MKLKTFQGSYWMTAAEEQQRAVQQAQDALNAMAPNDVSNIRRLLMAWNRIADMTVSEFIGCALDKRLEAQKKDEHVD